MEDRDGERITYVAGKTFKDVPVKKRREQIVHILENAKEPMSAKEIAIEMFKKGLVPSDERNFSAPRLNELVKMEIVEEVEKKVCQYSGHIVWTYKLKGKKYGV